MKEFIDKLIGRLEEEHERCINRYGVVGGNLPATEVKQCMEIVNELAEEYGKETNVTTNADRIRSMTDEELAEFLNCIHEQDEDTILIPNGNKYESYHSDDEILDWLQSEVEGVTENE